MRAVALHPAFKLRQMLGVLEISDRDLMGAPSALDLLTIDGFGSCPPLGCTEHDHRPARSHLTVCLAASACGGLNAADFGQNGIERARQGLVDERWVVTLDEMRIVTVTAQQVRQLLTADTRQHRRIGNLETIEMEDRHDGAVAGGIEKLVRVPTGRQNARFGLAVANDARNDEIGVVERGTIGVHQRIPQLSAFVDGAW